VTPRRERILRTAVNLVVGLDFGTSTVKCIVTAERVGEGVYHRKVIKIDGQSLFPSAAYFRDGILSIGEPPSHDSAIIFRSTKSCLRCQVLKEEPCRRCFDGTGLSAELVVWAILSYCVSRIKDAIRKRLPDNAYAIDWERVEWKMGVPLDSAEQEPLRCLFRDILWRAVHYGETVKKHTPLAELGDAYSKMGDIHCPPDAWSNCFVVQEALVAVNAFLLAHENRKLIEPGLYCLCDVGAGTLDVAFFRYSNRADRPIVFYAASSTRVGGDSFAEVLSKVLMREQSGVALRQAYDQAILMLAHDCANACRKLRSCFSLASPEIERISKSMQRGRNIAFDRAYKKENAGERWEGLKVILMGGGASIPDVPEFLKSNIRYPSPDDPIRADEVTFDVAPLEGATRLHGIAHGLSIPIARYSEHWDPSEFGPIDLRAREAYDPFPGGDPYGGPG
jgi:hypothetical protein